MGRLLASCPRRYNEGVNGNGRRLRPCPRPFCGGSIVCFGDGPPRCLLCARDPAQPARIGTLWRRPRRRNGHQDGPEGLLERIFEQEDPSPERERQAFDAMMQTPPGPITSRRAPVALGLDF